MRKRFDGSQVEIYLDMLLNEYHSKGCKTWIAIADDLELSNTHTSQIFRGKKRPGPKACKVLGLTREWTYYPVNGNGNGKHR